jgi:uncharacterized protein
MGAEIMGNSLQDQLLKAGLVDERRAKKAKAERYASQKAKIAKAKRQGAAKSSESSKAVHRAMVEKAAADRARESKRKSKAERKALAAQIRQLIKEHRLPRDEAELGYHFEDGKKIRKIYVTEAIRGQLVAGRLAIVRLEGRYDVVPLDVAGKIEARNPACVVSAGASPGPAVDAEDPYADHPVPDDLIW